MLTVAQFLIWLWMAAAATVIASALTHLARHLWSTTMPARKRHARPPRRTPWFAPLEACHARTGFEERAQICQRSCCVPTVLPRRTDTTADPHLIAEARDWFRTPGALETKAVGR